MYSLHMGRGHAITDRDSAGPDVDVFVMVRDRVLEDTPPTPRLSCDYSAQSLISPVGAFTLHIFQ